MVNQTTKVFFDTEEWYPVYEETDRPFSGSYEVELTQYELFMVRRKLQEFRHVQEMIKKKIKEAGYDI